MITPLRGHVYRIAIGTETLVGLVVSADWLNAEQDTCITLLVVADRSAPPLPHWVRLKSGDPAFGHVVCRDIGMVHKDELKEDLGPMSMETMVEVGQALRRVLGL